MATKMAFTTPEDIKKDFIEKGWAEDIEFSIVTHDEAKKFGNFGMAHSIKHGHTFFKMNSTGNIYDDKGRIAMYNL